MEIDEYPIPFAILQIYFDNLVQDIQGDVIYALYEKQVLTENEYHNIKSEV